MAKFPEISYIFNQRGSSLGRHVNAASLKSLEIQALVYHKNQEPIWSETFLNNSFQLLLYIVKVKSQEDQWFCNLI